VAGIESVGQETYGRNKEVLMDSNQGVMPEQLSLFNDEYTLLNSGVLELIRLDLDEAKKTFQRCKEMWGDSGDIDGKVKLIDFLIRGFANAPDNCTDEPAYLFKLWKSAT